VAEAPARAAAGSVAPDHDRGGALQIDDPLVPEPGKVLDHGPLRAILRNRGRPCRRDDDAVLGTRPRHRPGTVGEFSSGPAYWSRQLVTDAARTCGHTFGLARVRSPNSSTLLAISCSQRRVSKPKRRCGAGQ
jgi:hypothetical protein